MKRDKETKKLSYTHTQSFLYVQGKHTPEKERKKLEKKKKKEKARERERERERDKKTQDYTPKL
jgi:hypothetical protein